MKRVYISQPMRGLTDEEIQLTREDALLFAQKYLGEDDIREIPNFVPSNKSRKPLEALGSCIALMADADLVIFCQDWETARGCRIEHAVAEEYDMHFKQL